MPAERPRQLKCSAVDGAHLTWAVPVEPASPQSIAFAPNVTPVTFSELPARAEARFEPFLFPSSAGSECSESARRSTHGKKRGEGHIPRPPNAFILFRSSFIKSQHVSTEVETNHSTLSKIIGLTWQNMPQDERQVWHAKAKKALEEHRMKWPQYTFRPSHTKSKGGTEKRKVREVEPKDMKRCAKIAELLVEGKKGADLDVAIQEFDRTHVPEVVTRFEIPITAGSYRRSSSAPIHDAKSNETTSSSPHRHARSASSQPSARPVDQPRAPARLTSSQSCPDLSGTHSFSASECSFSSRSQPSFELDGFAFDVAFGDSILPAGANLGSYPAITGRVPTPTLCFDPAYRGDWTPDSSPFSSSPATPQALSPSPVFDCALDSEDPFALSSFPTAVSDQLHQPCHQPYPGLQVFDQDTSLPDDMFAQPDFATFSKDPFSFDCSEKSIPGVGADLSMTAFLSSLSAF